MIYSAYEPFWLGCWKGVVKVFDFSTGKLIDEGTTNATITVNDNVMAISESYQWSNGRLEEYTLTGEIVNQNCIFDTKRFKGSACKVDQKTLVVHGTTFGNDGQVLSDFHGAYFFLTQEYRIRNSSYIQDDVLKTVRCASEYKVEP